MQDSDSLNKSLAAFGMGRAEHESETKLETAGSAIPVPEGKALDQLIDRWESIVKATERDCAVAASEIAKKGNVRRLAFFQATLSHLRKLKNLTPPLRSLTPEE